MDIRDIASALAPRNDSGGLLLRFGIVQSVQTNTATVSIGASANVAGIHWLKPYAPAANDKVAILSQGPSLIILGSVS